MMLLDALQNITILIITLEYVSIIYRTVFLLPCSWSSRSSSQTAAYSLRQIISRWYITGKNTSYLLMMIDRWEC